jgi:hypothetical protein
MVFEGNKVSFIENQYRLKNLQKCSVSDLEAMMETELNAINNASALAV